MAKAHQTIGEMVREKLASAASRVSEEISGQPPQQTKEAAAPADADLVKLAEQVDYVALHLKKVAQLEGPGPGVGAGAMDMQTPTTEGAIPTGGAAKDPDNRTPSTGAPDMASSADAVQTPATKIQDDYSSPPGEGDTLSIAGMKQAQVRIANLFRKFSASEEALSAEQPSSQGPGRGPGSLGVSDEVKPPIPSEGQPVQDTQKAIDVTQQETKAPVKSELAGVLDEPALSKSTDPVLDNAFDNTPGAKISEDLQAIARRLYLQKVAARGCTCGGQGVCEYCGFIKHAQESEEEKKEDSEEDKKEDEKDKKDESESETQEPGKSASAGGAIRH